MREFRIKINNTIFNGSNFREINELATSGNKAIYKNIVSFLSSWTDKEAFIETGTSGSTGKPKFIRLLKSSMEYSARRTCSFLNLNDQHSALLCLPVEFIAGKMMLVRAMVSGLNLVVANPAGNPFKDLGSLIDFAAITPFQLYKSMEDLKTGKVKKLLVGGAPVTSELLDKLMNLPVEIYESFGMTETCSHIALRKINKIKHPMSFQIMEGVEISTDDRQCLVIKDPQILKKPLVTNDLVEITDEKHFKWLGRIDHVINSAGIKLFPEQIENKISSIFHRKFYIKSVDDKLLNNKVVLVLEGEKLSEEEEKELFNKIREVVTPYETPKEIRYISKIQFSDNGKIIR